MTTTLPLDTVHFIGVGGAGMSALARILVQRGANVSGSDMKESRYTRTLRELGATITSGHDPANLVTPHGTPDIVVVSTAIPENNPELVAARERGLTVWQRAQMLSALAGKRRTIAVAGTHGKTSTSSMIATMLRAMKLDPSFCVGGLLEEAGSNAEHGTGDYYVVEADESDGSFLFLEPDVALITNIERDHLDHYANLTEIDDIFIKFAAQIRADGTLILCGDDSHLLEVMRKATVSTGVRTITYGADEACDVRYRIVGREGIGTRFEVIIDDEVVCTAGVATPGEHMVCNACGALAVAYVEGLDMRDAAKALATFTGVRRRFSLIGEYRDITIVDDYAHHPTEVEATLKAAQALDFTRVVTIVQPHRYSRVEAFCHEFGRALTHADLVIVTQIYSAGEAPIPGVNGRSIVDALLDVNERANVVYLPHRKDIVPYVARSLRRGDLVMTMGAGDVTSIGPELLRELHEQDDDESHDG
ncbi:MAG: UDP-N-acetylmuramate--L-alanine ligase [Coriobacteriia bacterium]|nr:UDP-N-acetylmuramate--L-alanine ligase [Coriobacteriia bacterium]